MKKIVLQCKKECFFSGTTNFLELHHIFGGPDRWKSEKYGLVVWLNHYYHNEPPCVFNLYFGSPHHKKDVDLILKKFAQNEFEKIYSRDLFIKEFGKNYL